MKATTLILATAACLFAAAACRSTTVRGPNNESVTATAPSSLTIHRGEVIPLKVSLDRDNYSGPVTVSLSQLPRGVEADEITQTVDNETATFALKASEDADLVEDQTIGVTVDAMNGRRATQYVALTVED